MITRELFLKDRHGKTFADVLNDPDAAFDTVLDFFSNEARCQRMEDAEMHHDRAPLAGVVRELESIPALARFFATLHGKRSARLRQAIGVLVRMIMEDRGWKTTGKKGSLGVRGTPDAKMPAHNTGGLALWFIRAERYEKESGIPFTSVRRRCEEFEAARLLKTAGGKAKGKTGTAAKKSAVAPTTTAKPATAKTTSLKAAAAPMAPAKPKVGIRRAPGKQDR